MIFVLVGSMSASLTVRVLVLVSKVASSLVAFTPSIVTMSVTKFTLSPSKISVTTGVV